ncbi:probable polygalacturonase At1g80170 isoform X2 [Musa acuminata AAA Group]|uniref:probable polygalacturonase At1g80170 isoform X2 n=1 Tax=Musa acuminata AAA Group TaxID=214697 RepID=UPI0031E056A6
MVDDQYVIFVRNRSSSKDATSRSVIAAILLLLYPIMIGRAKGLPESSSLIQLPRSADHKTKVVISVNEFGAKGNGFDDDTLISGTIIAPSDPDIWDGLDPRKWIYFHGIKQIVVRGGGTLDGKGHNWWSRSCKRNTTYPCRHAPTAITFHRSKHVAIRDLTVLNGQQMHIAFTSCSHVRASRLKVTAPAESPNTDGIHISGSIATLVEDSTIRAGDDCISIVGNSSNIRVINIICGPGHGISIGSLGKSNSYSQVHDVKVENSLISNTENGVRIKTWQGGSGYARKIVFRGIRMSNVSNPIIIDQYYCDSSRQCQNQTSAVKVHQISFIEIKGTSTTKDAIKFSCSDSSPCEKIYLQDINMSLESGGNASAYCWKASGFSSGLVNPPSCLTRAVVGLINQNVGSSKKVEVA